MKKIKVAFFDFTCCEGCQLQVANMGEMLLDVLGLIEVVNFREVMSERSDDYDVAIVEGSITGQKVKSLKNKTDFRVANFSKFIVGELWL